MAKEISFKEWLKVIKNRIWTVIIVTMVMTMAGYLYSMVIKPVPLYQSSARVVIGGNASNLNTFQVMVKDPTVLNKVSKQINHLRSPGELNSEITANTINSSQVISISVVDQNAKVAAKTANRTADVFINKATQIMSSANIRLLSGANASSVPINPVNHHKVIEGFGVGVILGIGLVFLLNGLDDTVRTEQDLEKLLSAPVFGSIAKITNKKMYNRRKFSWLRKNSIDLSNVSKVKFNKKKRKPHQPSEVEHNHALHKESKTSP